MARKKVGLTGVNGLGQVTGINPFWGALASGGLGQTAAAGLRLYGMDKHANLAGLGTGLLVGVGLLMSDRTRAAGFTGIVTALATSGFAWAMGMLSAKEQIKDLKGAEVTYLATKAPTKIPVAAQLAAAKAAAVAGNFGTVTVEPRQLAGGLGTVTVEQRQLAGQLGALSYEQRQVLSGQLGALSAEQRQVLAGAGLGIVSPEVIRSLNAHDSQPPATIVGAGALSSLYGATCMDGGRG